MEKDETGEGGVGLVWEVEVAKERAREGGR
jgi:hypothetical protein